MTEKQAQVPQIIALLNREVEQDIEINEKRILHSLLMGGAFRNFLYRQNKVAREMETGLDPYSGDFTPDTFFQAAKDARLLTRFWADLLQYVNDLDVAVFTNNNEQEN